MREAGHHDAVEIGQHRLHGLRALRRRGRQLFLDIAGLHLRHHRAPLDALPIFREPVDETVAVLPELVGGHCAVRPVVSIAGFRPAIISASTRAEPWDMVQPIWPWPALR